MDIGERMRELARNLYWTWRPELIEVFRDLDPSLWREVNHNPVEFLSRLDEPTLAERASTLALDARISRAFFQMHEYLQARDTWGVRHAGPLHARPVAYFSAEFGLHESLPIYSGGLGVLAGDHLKAASDLGVPLVGVGLFYAKGYFHQRLDADGWQEEDYFDADVEKLPLDWATDSSGKALRVTVPTGATEIQAGVRTARVGRNHLVLLDTNVEGNSDEDRSLTAQLYGGDRRVRIRQELVLGVGGMRAILAMGICPGAIHLNEGHTAFAVLELARSLMERDGRSFDEVRSAAASMTVFTTHTPVAAGHDRFDPEMFNDATAPLREKLGISPDDLLALGRADAGDAKEPFCMTVLGLRMSAWRNAVSARHGRVTRAMWRDLWPGRAEEEVPIGHITNGVHLASWLSIPMAALYDRFLGADWQERLHLPETWAGVEDINEVEFWEQHQILKAQLVEYVDRCLRRQEQRRTAAAKAADPAPPRLNPSALTVGFARRFAPYKRADLLLGDLERLARLVSDPQRPVQIIFAGKAHPRDEQGKGLVQQVFRVTREKRFLGKVVFLENHDINMARHLVQGVDLWLNTPRRPQEASGTSGQKAVLNGGLNLSTLDGWWAEACDGTNGFAIGCGGEHADPRRQDETDRQVLFDVLEQQVVPLFYRRNEKDIPHDWIRRQKNALRTLPWRFSALRMVMDYTTRCYLPAAGGQVCSFPASRPEPG